MVMLPALRKAMLQSGAALNGDASEPPHFGDAAAELRAALNRCALVDRSALGRVLATGPDFLDLLHRLSTADVKRLQPGQGVPAVVTSPKGRIVERIFVHHLGREGQLLVTGPGGAARTIDHLNRFTFSEQTGLADVSDAACQLALIGPAAGEALDAAGLGRPERCGSLRATLEGVEMTVLGEDGLGCEGYSVVAGTTHAGALWRLLARAAQSNGGLAAGTQAAESWRVLQGLPASGFELNDHYNPLEAGLRDAVSFSKGCYVGQEVIARLDTYDKVARSLCGLELEPGRGVPPPGAALFVDDRNVGELTSAVRPPGWPYPVALAYVKRKSAAETVAVRWERGAMDARVVKLPFLDRSDG
jgi:folate-binding protein YgfZ